MPTTHITELDYYPDSCIYFEQIRPENQPIFLDSCHPYSDKGRYDILSAAPVSSLTTQGEATTIMRGPNLFTSTADPFLLLRTELARYPQRHSILPFNGGALGFFAYDLNQRLEVLPKPRTEDIHLPQMAVGIYLWAVVVDHLLKKTYLLEPPLEAQPAHWSAIKQRLLNMTLTSSKEPFRFTSAFRSNMNATEYASYFAHIMQHLRQGDFYQMNFAQRWQAGFTGDPWVLYRHLRQQNPAPFAAFIDLPHGAILSCSPERFLTVTDNQITTLPIKGTKARSVDPIADEKAAHDLLHSPKDRAENTMIVDLMRNDLGKSCQIGSVQVPELCTLQSFASVHHLVSTVTGQLHPEKHSLDVLRDCFPGGSITGAPKVRVMQLINQYEPHARSIYCGSIGYIDCNGRMDTNIAIRTALAIEQQLYVWGGGGIVIDSTMEREYQESMDKVRPFLDCYAHLT